jgi:uncharacterized membrane protein
MSDIARPRPFIHTPWKARIIGFVSAGAAAALILVFAPSWLAGTQRAVAAYDAAALLLICIFWFLAMHGHATDTEVRAAVEDPGRNVVLALVLASIVGGLVSAISIIGRGPHVQNPTEKALVYALGLGAVFLGWFLIHTLLTFRYAHLYYFDDDGDNESDRGLKFPGTETPNDYDFAYFSFVVGMTFQVSDVVIVDSRVRRLVLLHGLISFVYNSTILALVINLVSGLIPPH